MRGDEKRTRSAADMTVIIREFFKSLDTQRREEGERENSRRVGGCGGNKVDKGIEQEAPHWVYPAKRSLDLGLNLNMNSNSSLSVCLRIKDEAKDAAPGSVTRKNTQRQMRRYGGRWGARDCGDMQADKRGRAQK